MDENLEEHKTRVYTKVEVAQRQEFLRLANNGELNVKQAAAQAGIKYHRAIAIFRQNRDYQQRIDVLSSMQPRQVFLENNAAAVSEELEPMNEGTRKSQNAQETIFKAEADDSSMNQQTMNLQDMAEEGKGQQPRILNLFDQESRELTQITNLIKA